MAIALRHIFLLNLLLFLAGLAWLIVGVPMIVRRRCRQVGLPQPSFFKTAIRSLVTAVAVGCGMLLLLMLCELLPEPTGIVIPVGGILISIWLARHFVTTDNPAFGRRTVWLVGLSFVALILANIAALTLSLQRAEHLAKRAMTGANLNAIGKALDMYHQAHNTYPAGLPELVAEKSICWNHLLSSRSAPGTGSNHPIDFVYFRPREEFPPDLVVAYEPPSFNDGDGGWVLPFDLKVHWLDADKLNAEVARTEKWINDHPAPASRPAESTSTAP